MSQEERPTILLDYTLIVQCPKCGEEFDIVEQDSNRESDIAKLIFNNKWDETDGHSVQCTHCGHQFLTGKVEY